MRNSGNKPNPDVQVQHENKSTTTTKENNILSPKIDDRRVKFLIKNYRQRIKNYIQISERNY